MSAVARHCAPLAVVDDIEPYTPEVDWVLASTEQRAQAERVRTIVEAVCKLVDSGVRLNTAAGSVAVSIETGRGDKALVVAGRRCARGKKTAPSVSSIKRWYYDFQRCGVAGLLPSYQGSARTAYGWEARAMHLYARPQRPAFATVAHWLREEGFESALDSRVRRYLKSLPTDKTTSAPARVGRHYYDQNKRPYMLRDHADTPVGFIYQGDGHACDVYVQHPKSGNHFRPELTAWIDVRSRYLVGWWLSESESAVTTLYGLSHAIVAHNHVPAAIHTDPGSGFQNKMMDAQVTGYLNRLSIEAIRAIAGNAKGKGLIERWFGIFEERCGKRYETYCGHCRTDDALARFATKVRRGEMTVPHTGAVS